MRASRVVALEPDGEMIRELKRMDLPRVEPVTETLEGFAEASQDRFDHVVMINVLEHIGDDRRA